MTISMCNNHRLRAIARIIKNLNVKGDIVECGVYKGGMIINIIRALQDKTRTIWMYDTFEGNPESQSVDRKKTGEHGLVGKNMCPLEEVLDNVHRTCYPAKNMLAIEGKVEDTIPNLMPERIAFLHLDTNFYSSISHCLKHLWPLVVPGGYMVLDDYGTWLGCRKAVDEWLVGKDLVMNKIDASSRVVKKPTS